MNSLRQFPMTISGGLPQPVQCSDDILDSLYSAIGIAAACLDDVLDFNTFLRTTLVPEVQMTAPNYNLLRRRTAILLGQWVPIEPETIDRVAVCKFLPHPNRSALRQVLRHLSRYKWLAVSPSYTGPSSDKAPRPDFYAPAIEGRQVQRSRCAGYGRTPVTYGTGTVRVQIRRLCAVRHSSVV